jgi:hypothetical protein
MPPRATFITGAHYPIDGGHLTRGALSLAENLDRSELVAVGDGTLVPEDAPNEVRPPISLLGEGPVLIECRPRPIVDRRGASARADGSRA